MSRHIIPNAPGSPAVRETVVGWDPPLSTFFAMAFDGDEEVFWVGADPGEIPTVHLLDKALGRHGVELPMLVAERLSWDQQQEGDRSDNPGRRIVDAMLAERNGGGS